MSDIPLAQQDLAALVDEWLSWDEAAELIGVTPAKVRTMVREHKLAAAVPGEPGQGVRQGIPALFIVDGEPVILTAPTATPSIRMMRLSPWRTAGR